MAVGFFNRFINKNLEAFQNELIEKHVYEVENMYREMRGWRHDYSNQIQVMKIAFENGQYEKVRCYLDALGDNLSKVDTVIKTGNIMIDAILNSKISLAISKSISVNAKAIMPVECDINEVDLCAMLGNIMNNAIEGCLTQKNEGHRFIRIFIGQLKNNLYISVSNSYEGKLRKNGALYTTTKPDRSRHGFGLMRIDSIAKKYGGYVNRQSEEGAFVTEVILPLSHELNTKK